MNIGIVELMGCMNLSSNHHFGQRYGDRDYFNYHIRGVVKSLSNSGYGNSHTSVAYLHDALEDTLCSPDEIRNIIGEDALQSVIALTKNYFGEETLDEYLTRCKTNEVARVVKLHDAMFNLSNSFKEGSVKRINKYLKTIEFLTTGG